MLLTVVLEKALESPLECKEIKPVSLFIFIFSVYYKLSFFPPFIFTRWRLITLQYLCGFLPYIDMNQPWIYMCSPTRSSLPPPSPSHPITLWQIDRETVETVTDFFWRGPPRSLQMVTATIKLKDACSLEGKL